MLFQLADRATAAFDVSPGARVRPARALVGDTDQRVTVLFAQLLRARSVAVAG